ncbi:glycerophosphodiester phosphodiesterase [Microvirga rosea]|uniref:glycerophosphodiester phosphodiesterase n=1 Tax=Microvirga rosea TaxID=2715425 RepID=UPI001D0BA5B6|nr:glycerophosphodiester phosphodiesterase family protein [Microvirga rosea]MCB8820573.1 glycerophosphodiester phosphodiesterase family protein [Microvirga rosea]
MTRPLVIAHRGYSARYTENTLTAYRAAISAGVDLVESDARLSKDGAVWSCHDATLERLTGDKRAVANLTSMELGSIVLPGNERLVMLRDVLAQVAPERKVLIDVKTVESDLIYAIVRDVKEAQVQDRVWIGMRSPDQMRRARRLEPRLSFLAFLPDYTLADTFESAGATVLRVWEGDLDRPETAALLKERQVWVTAGGRGTRLDVGDTTRDRLRRILDHRPSAILLNDPLMLAGMATMSAPDDSEGGSTT